MEDRGGGLARINGKVRLLEGLAQPREEDEFGLSYYNSMTTWIHIDKLLKIFGLERSDLFTKSETELADAVHNVARNMPTYVTIKDVKIPVGARAGRYLPGSTDREIVERYERTVRCAVRVCCRPANPRPAIKRSRTIRFVG